MNKRTHEALRKIAAGKLERGLNKFRVGAQNFFNRLYDPGVPEIPNEGYPTVADWQRYANQPRNTARMQDDYSRRLGIAQLMAGHMYAANGDGSFGARHDKDFRNRMKSAIQRSRPSGEDLVTAFDAGRREREAERLLGIDY